MCSKQDFAERIMQGIADRKAAREAAEIEEQERRLAQHRGYLRDKTDGHGKKLLSGQFYQC